MSAHVRLLWIRATYALPNRGPPSALRNSPFVSPTETRPTSREGLPKKPTNDPPLLPRNTDAPARLPLMAYGETYMSIYIGTYKCTGYADYAIGYEKRLGGLLAVVEAKKGATYNWEKSVAQTLLYLGMYLHHSTVPSTSTNRIVGMLRESRLRLGKFSSSYILQANVLFISAGKSNATVYGVATDSKQYKFMSRQRWKCKLPPPVTSKYAYTNRWQYRGNSISVCPSVVPDPRDG